MISPLAGLSIARFAKRGLLECCARGRWRLTRAGHAPARRLCPDFKAPTKRELARNIALRKAIQIWEDEHPALSGKRRGTKARSFAPIDIADFERVRPGIEVKLDLSGL